jgi:phosphate butyryltransferase
MLKNFNDLIEQIKNKKKIKIAIAAAEDIEILTVIEEATKLDLAEFILIGDKEKIFRIASDNKMKCDYEIINEPDNKKAAEKAVELIKNDEAKVIMKGLLHTGTFLKAVLNKERGLNKGGYLSQVSVIDKEYGEGLQLITDCAISIEPSLEDKKKIIDNAISLALKVGYSRPRIALLSAVELVNPSIKDTMDAAILSKMAERGQIKNAIVDGPLALDNAISSEAAKHKGLKGEVAGNADILVVPNLQVGNIFTKTISYYAHKDVASAVVGAEVPIIMTSRTDSVKNKLLSVALTSYIS